MNWTYLVMHSCRLFQNVSRNCVITGNFARGGMKQVNLYMQLWVISGAFRKCNSFRLSFRYILFCLSNIVHLLSPAGYEEEKKKTIYGMNGPIGFRFVSIMFKNHDYEAKMRNIVIPKLIIILWFFSYHACHRMQHITFRLSIFPDLAMLHLSLVSVPFKGNGGAVENWRSRHSFKIWNKFFCFSFCFDLRRS